MISISRLLCDTISPGDSLRCGRPDRDLPRRNGGNIRNKRFNQIWSSASGPLLNCLRNRKGLLKDCCSRCAYLDLCNGNLRVRAEAVYGDVWAEDPACYLSDKEIGINYD
ncbi:MAG: SPASM domain-containing protein [Chloroflexota bacterium]